VTDAQAYAELVHLLERAKVITELATACSLAAARQAKARFAPDDHVVVVLCGGNTSVENIRLYEEQLRQVER